MAETASVERVKDRATGLEKFVLREARGSSVEAHFKPPKAIRGGIQICFPQVDKIYLSAPQKVVIIDHEKKRTFVLRKDGLPDVVVWNPWDKKAKAMPDFGDEEYKNMLCVGAAAIEKPITLKPGEEWQGRQEISAVPSSYSSGQLDPEVIRRMHTI
ncbi:hypothetical protein PR202_ga06629 [Eleusine coracana subsp. coracana]|uniref:Glucose-6-phosphate 1-epimerase n=1 Tax=Eleusine coracana subsp. coracana TaxID=191504 RepID=A0AAV5BXX9_ELECO|nr:hypothetical protein PR202_ga06629 [Eleusine coracana subsp. coracana]